MVKDEADVVEEVVRHMLTQVDVVVMADNMSSDGTSDILSRIAQEFPARMFVPKDRDPAHYQSRKMSRLAAQAARGRADWVVPFDADEIWYSADGRTIAEVLLSQPDDVSIVEALLFHHEATAADPGGAPTRSMGWRRQQPLGLPKIACRPLVPVTIHDGNHGADYGGRAGGLEIRHFPYRSAEQFVRKARNGNAALSATDLPRSTGEHWRLYGEHLQEHGEESLQAWFREHFYCEHPATHPGLVFDPAPLGAWDQ